MTDSGEKKEDYREINEYWIKRLCFKPTMGCKSDFPMHRRVDTYLIGKVGFVFKRFETNTMTLGYPKKGDTDRIRVYEHAGIEIRTGNPKWGAEPNKLYFVIKHGKRIN